MRSAWALSALLLISGSGDPTASKLVGYWYGENYQPGEHANVQEIDHILPDGTFENEFRRYEHCKLVDRSIETGTWSVTNGVERLITRSVDGKALDPVRDPTLIADYQILLLDDHDLQQKHVASGTIFKVRRVDEKFRFPDCSNTT